jgi:hypothetical protein
LKRTKLVEVVYRLLLADLEQVWLLVVLVLVVVGRHGRLKEMAVGCKRKVVESNCCEVWTKVNPWTIGFNARGSGGADQRLVGQRYLSKYCKLDFEVTLRERRFIYNFKRYIIVSCQRRM